MTLERAIAVLLAMCLPIALALVTDSAHRPESNVVTAQGNGPTANDLPDITACLTELAAYSYFVSGTESVDLLPEDLVFGAFTSLHAFSDDFYTMEATENLVDEVETVDEWIASLSHAGTVKGGIVVALDSSDNSYYCSAILEADMGESLSLLQAGDKLLWEPATNAHMILRDDMVIPVDLRAERFIAEPTTLSAFQVILHAYFE